ncbi:MAG: hypothetical protein ACLU3U_11595 [Gallintestinimicrobium sp.]
MERVKTAKCCMDMTMRNQRNTCAGMQEQGHKGPLFGLRLAISLILFACVIYLDKNQIDWKGQSAVAVINRQLDTSVIGNSTVEALH